MPALSASPQIQIRRSHSRPWPCSTSTVSFFSPYTCFHTLFLKLPGLKLDCSAISIQSHPFLEIREVLPSLEKVGCTQVRNIWIGLEEKARIQWKFCGIGDWDPFPFINDSQRPSTNLRNQPLQLLLQSYSSFHFLFSPCLWWKGSAFSSCHYASPSSLCPFWFH